MHYCRDEEAEAWALCSSCNRFICVSLCHLPQLGLNSLVKPKLRFLVIQDAEKTDMKFDKNFEDYEDMKFDDRGNVWL